MDAWLTVANLFEVDDFCWIIELVLYESRNNYCYYDYYDFFFFLNCIDIAEGIMCATFSIVLAGSSYFKKNKIIVLSVNLSFSWLTDR